LRNQVDPGSVVALVFIMLFLYLIFTARRLDCACAMLVAFVLTSFPVALQLAPLALMTWRPAQRVLRASDADAVAVAMCVGTKTVALGIPIIQAVYENNPAAGLLSLPLIIYHAEQILLGSLLTAPLKRWVARRTQAAQELQAVQEEATKANGAGGADPEANGANGDAQPRRRRSGDGPDLEQPGSAAAGTTAVS
jgi:predicted Na+-dependent transporter